MTVATASHSEPPVRPPRRHPVRSCGVSTDHSYRPLGPVQLEANSAENGPHPRCLESLPTLPPPTVPTAAPTSSPPTSDSSSTPFSLRSRLARRPFDALEASSGRVGLVEVAAAAGNGARANERDRVQLASGLQLFGPAPTGGDVGGTHAGEVGEAMSNPPWRGSAEQGTAYHPRDLSARMSVTHDAADWKMWTCRTGSAFVPSPEETASCSDGIATTPAHGQPTVPPKSEEGSSTHSRSHTKTLGSRLRQVLQRRSVPATSNADSHDFAVSPDRSPTLEASHRSAQQLDERAILPPHSVKTTSPTRSPQYSPVHSPTSSLSPPNLRDDTPIPSPPAAALEDPSYIRPRPFRSLSWSFLPSRSARAVSNRQPLVDREMTDEEKQWVELTAKVPDDGSTRDRWDNPIGIKGDWGRTVLSEAATRWRAQRRLGLMHRTGRPDRHRDRGLELVGIPVASSNECFRRESGPPQSNRFVIRLGSSSFGRDRLILYTGRSNGTQASSRRLGRIAASCCDFGRLCPGRTEYLED